MFTPRGPAPLALPLARPSGLAGLKLSAANPLGQPVSRSIVTRLQPLAEAHEVPGHLPGVQEGFALAGR